MPNAETAISIRLEIQNIRNLPPLPVIAQQILAAINNENADIDEIAAIMQRDPSLTSRILGLSNSAFFGFARKVYTLEEAIINVLGLDLVRGLAFTMVMGGVFNIQKCKEFDLTRYWCSALMTADLAMRTASIIPPSRQINSNHLFLYGLLHNIGILVLTDRLPELMSEIFRVAKGHPDRRLIYTEQSMLDIDHHQAGAWLTEKWGLPDDVVRVIACHHQLDYREEYMHEILITGFCSRTTSNWISGNNELLDDDDEIYSLTGIDKHKMQAIAEKCRTKHADFKEMAREMTG
ncbi:MAG: HDOD domain-containing protein [Gammaproteobacteria bacterium]|nr:HDOD domain-containing protein [Gammaproteobacteria bacterium]